MRISHVRAAFTMRIPARCQANDIGSITSLGLAPGCASAYILPKDPTVKKQGNIMKEQQPAPINRGARDPSELESQASLTIRNNVSSAGCHSMMNRQMDGKQVGTCLSQRRKESQKQQQGQNMSLLLGLACPCRCLMSPKGWVCQSNNFNPTVSFTLNHLPFRDKQFPVHVSKRHTASCVEPNLTWSPRRFYG